MAGRDDLFGEGRIDVLASVQASTIAVGMEQATTRVSVSSYGAQSNGYSGTPTVSADGRYAAFISHSDNLVPGDSNGKMDVFVHDRLTGQTTRVSVASDGTQSNGESEIGLRHFR
ncbi:MAG: PD40 domain-containing protein [Chloroflexi bacterium]|nr:PD40 domain-containing protein [Chloroflexota bacterium]